MVHGEHADRGRSTEPDRAEPPAGGEALSAPAKRRQRGVGHLASALGLNRRTLYKLQAAGAPATTDEATWRTWLRRERPRMRVRDPVALDVPRGPNDLDDDASDGDAPDADGADAAAAGGASSATTGGIALPESWAQEKSRRDAEVATLKAKSLELEIGAQERRLIDRADVIQVVGAVAIEIVGELVDLPARAVESVASLPIELRKPVRRAIERAISDLRGRVSTTLRARLRAALAPKGDANGS